MSDIHMAGNQNDRIMSVTEDQDLHLDRMQLDGSQRTPNCNGNANGNAGGSDTNIVSSPPSTLLPKLNTPSPASSPSDDYSPVGAPCQNDQYFTTAAMDHGYGGRESRRRMRRDRRRNYSRRGNGTASTRTPRYNDGSRSYPKYHNDNEVSTPETYDSSDFSTSDSSISTMHTRIPTSPNWGYQQDSYYMNSNQSCNSRPLKRRTQPAYPINHSMDHEYHQEAGNIIYNPQIHSNRRKAQRPNQHYFYGILALGFFSFTIMAMFLNNRLIIIRMDSDFSASSAPHLDHMSSRHMINKHSTQSSVKRNVAGLRPITKDLEDHRPTKPIKTNKTKKLGKKSEKKDKKKEDGHVKKQKKNKHKNLSAVADPWKHRKKKKPWGPDPLMYLLEFEDFKEINDEPPKMSYKPRMFTIDQTMEFASSPSREIELYPAKFSDNTQLYSVLDSNDEALSRMELRTPYEEGECVPMKEWQTTFHPTCNGVHEIDLIRQPHPDSGTDIHLFGTKGYWRNAWRVDFECKKLNETHFENCHDSVVLKTLKYHHNFEDAHFEHDRIDAIAMERLTSSPHVINIFGFCAHSVITEFADGQRVGTLADKSKRKPLARLKIARDIASGLADVHGIDGDEQPTFVHFDINPANVVSIGGTLKLNDFNIGIPLKKNVTTGEACGFPSKYPNPQWRSPEEANDSQHLTEKVDVFSLGHILFRLVCLHEPWHKLEPGGKPSKEFVNEQVKIGNLPFIPEEVWNTDSEEVAVIRDAMLDCYTFDPEKRPSARSIADRLERALIELSQPSQPRILYQN